MHSNQGLDMTALQKCTYRKYACQNGDTEYDQLIDIDFEELNNPFDDDADFSCKTNIEIKVHVHVSTSEARRNCHKRHKHVCF